MTTTNGLGLTFNWMGMVLDGRGFWVPGRPGYSVLSVPYGMVAFVDQRLVPVACDRDAVRTAFSIVNLRSDSSRYSYCSASTFEASPSVQSDWGGGAHGGTLLVGPFDGMWTDGPLSWVECPRPLD